MENEVKLDEIKPDKVVDARGAYCPGPYMETIKAIRKMEPGQVLVVLTSERGSLKDIPKWVEKSGHELLGIVEEEGYWKLIIRKGSK